jgi:coenzyme F420-0:L-glutamate ligase/coenzyme F420-1:gamma-L-glutamate ligase
LNKIEIFPLKGLPIIKKDDDLAFLICEAAEKQGISIKNGDIIVITHVVVARAEGNVVDLEKIIPSEFAKSIAHETRKDPKLVEIILRESICITRMNKGKLITKSKQGIICANSGIDYSNVPGKTIVALLPKNSDKSAKMIRKKIQQKIGKDVAVIISDTHGRPLRKGEINIALGTSGINPLRDRRGEEDLFGYKIKVKRTAIADELASAAELVIGQTNESIPVALIRGYKYPKSETKNAKNLIRPSEEDLFL